jgi:hypothetical protein
VDSDLFDQWLRELGYDDPQKLLDFALCLVRQKYQGGIVSVDRVMERRGFCFPIFAIETPNGNVYHESGENWVKGKIRKGGIDGNLATYFRSF